MGWKITQKLPTMDKSIYAPPTKWAIFVFFSKSQGVNWKNTQNLPTYLL